MSTLIKRSFVGGELAPTVQARVDTSKYEHGLKTCRNFLVMRHGGIQNRPGTKFLGEIIPYAPPDRIRLIPFIVSDTQSYVLEIGFGVMRVLKNGAYVSVSASGIFSISQNIQCEVTTILPHGFATGDQIFINGVVGMGEMNFRDTFAEVTGANTFRVKTLAGAYIDSTGFGAYVGAGVATKIFRTTCPPWFTGNTEHLLKYVQTANSMVFVHAAFQPQELKRFSDISWIFTSMTFAPKMVAPAGLIVTARGGPASITYRYRVSSVNAITAEESLPTAIVAVVSGIPDGLAPANSIKLDWTAVPGAGEYNIYRETVPGAPAGSGTFGLIGIATGIHFEDIGQANISSIQPISANDPFVSEVPSCVTFFQQRIMFGGGEINLERIWGSRIGLTNNFTNNSTIQDDGSLQFDMVGSQINKVQNLINIGKLVVFTTGSESSLEGNASGILTPTEVNPKQYSQNGSSYVPPLVVGGNALYVQNRGAIVRDLAFEFQTDSYRGNDLTIFASHLFEGRNIVEWAWQQIPQSIVWCILDNGTMIALTYIREQQIWAWHRHDTDGLVEHICVIPEGGEDFVYLVVNRNGKRYVERLNTRIVSQSTISDAIFSDAELTFDFRNKVSTDTATLINSGTIVSAVLPVFGPAVINSPNWLAGVELILNIFGTFPAGAVWGTISPGAVFKITSPATVAEPNGITVTLTVTQTTNNTGILIVKPDKDIPLSLRGLATLTWGQAKNSVTGLWHLEGKAVSVLAEGFVLASPNNNKYPLATVTNGKLTFTDYFTVFNVGLPYISDMETLNIDSAQTETAIDKAKLVGRVTVALDQSRGMFVGAEVPSGSDPLDGLYELKIRDQELMPDPVALLTGYADVNLVTEWNSNGRILVRQTEPLPISVLAVAPGGFFPLRP